MRKIILVYLVLNHYQRGIMKKALLSAVLLLVSLSSFGEVQTSSLEINSIEVESTKLQDDTIEKEYSNSYQQNDSSELQDDQEENFNLYNEIRTLVVNKV